VRGVASSIAGIDIDALVSAGRLRRHGLDSVGDAKHVHAVERHL
jgi:hypothetical protein